MKNVFILVACMMISFACSPKSIPQGDKTSTDNSKPTPKPTTKAAPAPKADPVPKADPAPKAAPTPKANRVFFVEPKAGAKVSSPVKVVFGVEGMTISPAGQNMGDTTKGHHHLIIDGKGIAAGQPVPMNATHKHFGKGQTETSIKLAPGKHTLTMQFADAMHISYGEKMSTTIEIEVSK